MHHRRACQAQRPAGNQRKSGILAHPGQAAGSVEERHRSALRFDWSLAFNIRRQAGNLPVIDRLQPAALNAFGNARNESEFMKSYW